MIFSIITVCYNSEKTIRQTLESVRQQSYKDYEIIIIDGKSTDSTMGIVEEYKSLIPCMKVVSEPDTGIYNAMNKGIDLAEGEWIAFLNSDDYYEADALQLIANHCRQEIDVIYGQIYYLKYFDNILYKREVPKTDHSNLIRGEMLPHQGTFVRSGVMKNYKFDEKYVIAADYKLLLQLYIDKKVFKGIEGGVATMRDGGISSKEVKKTIVEKASCEKEVLGYKATKVKKQLFKILILKVMKKIIMHTYLKDIGLREYFKRYGWVQVE